MVTSNGGRDAIVWVMDMNVRRRAPLRGPNASRPVLYAFDALTLELLWKSAPDELASTGKYNEPAIARGVVYVGTDRIQAFGLLPAALASHPIFPSPFATDAQVAEKAIFDPKLLQAGQTFVNQRCVFCYDSGQPGIPTLDMISKLKGPRIVDALLNGTMGPQAVGLTETDAQAIAAYLNSLPAATKPAVQPSEPNVYVHRPSSVRAALYHVPYARRFGCVLSPTLADRQRSRARRSLGVDSHRLARSSSNNPRDARLRLRHVGYGGSGFAHLYSPRFRADCWGHPEQGRHQSASA